MINFTVGPVQSSDIVRAVGGEGIRQELVVFMKAIVSNTCPNIPQECSVRISKLVG